MQELYGLGLGSIFGSQANQASQGAQLGQGMWIATSNNTSGAIQGAQQVTVPAPIIITTSNGDRIDVAKEILLIRYILQRTVPDYDEIVKQFNAIEDIKGAEQWDK